jgi:hypothetical protein
VREAEDLAVNEQWSERVGTFFSFTKTVSEADIALFELISRDDDFVAEDPAPPVRQPRQIVPYPWLGSLLATAASHLLPLPSQAGFISHDITFIEPAYTDDILHMTVQVLAYDEARHSIRVGVTCQNQEYRRLADGEFGLDAHSPSVRG